MLSFAMFFDPADLLTQPAGEGLFRFQQFQLCATAVIARHFDRAETKVRRPDGAVRDYFF
jgi:hypothetical protein